MGKRERDREREIINLYNNLIEERTEKLPQFLLFSQ
jgi:hypothetical protein